MDENKVKIVYATQYDIADTRAYVDEQISKYTCDKVSVSDHYRSQESTDIEISRLHERVSYLETLIKEGFISEIAARFKDFVSSNEIESMSDEEFNQAFNKLLYE